MIDIDTEQPTIRRYLLRRLDEEGRRRFEERFVTDSEFREVALVVEDELIEDYLAELLTAEEREEFASHYLSTSPQFEELKLSRALREYATQGAAERTLDDADASAARGRHRIINLLFGKGQVPVLVVVFLFLIALGVWWSLAGRRRWGDQQAAVSAEVTLLNRQPLGNESVLTVTLTSVISRDPHQGQKLLIPSSINIAQFLLSLPGQQYQSYDITLRINDGPEVFTVSGLHAEDDGGNRLVKLRMPARLLTPEDYVLKVRGVNIAGQSEDVAEYFFRVVK
jgi:hypothetical protein